MGSNNQHILFWGPQCVGYWNQYFCAPVFERLKPFGWTTSYFFPPVNEFGSGLNKAWPSWYPHYDPLPNYNIIEDLGRSVYSFNDPASVAKALERSLAGENPDIIITRTNGHEYLKLLFPGVPILTMGEAMGSPWFEQHCFSLSADPNFYGLPHLTRHPEQASKMPKPDGFTEDIFSLLTRMQTVADEDMRAAEFYFSELRKKFDRIYLFPSDYTGAECLYLFYNHKNERFTTNADIIHHFKNQTNERTALLVTQHPLQAQRQSTTKLSDIFHPNGRVITVDNSKLASSLFRTSLLAHLSDGMIVRNSKSFWYALANDKPLLNLGSQDLSALGAYTDFGNFLNANCAAITRDEACRIFYWQTTRHRIALRENEKLSKMLHRVITTAAEVPNLEQSADLFEWGTEADYKLSFKHCAQTYNKDFYFP